uniref:Uncharacterized protein n=1 Tax=Romanomermis culicivorax TaxID=13658 RepID=A0A915IXF9_ROMCU
MVDMVTDCLIFVLFRADEYEGGMSTGVSNRRRSAAPLDAGPALSALWLEKNRPGALPFLSTQVSNAKSGIAGGYSIYDLGQPDKYEDLEHLIQLSLDYVQGQDQGNFSNPNVSKYKVQKLISIKEAIYQVVSGFNYKAIFTVGERDCSRNELDSIKNIVYHR